MTQDEIIEIAKQAGFDIGMWEKLSDDDDVFGYEFEGIHENLEAFAKLVADKERERMTVVAMDAAEEAVDVAMKLEREACAKIADEYAKGLERNYSEIIADLIRARGQA